MPPLPPRLAPLRAARSSRRQRSALRVEPEPRLDSHLLEEAAQADIAQRYLVDSMRRLPNPPGNVLSAHTACCATCSARGLAQRPRRGHASAASRIRRLSVARRGNFSTPTSPRHGLAAIGSDASLDWSEDTPPSRHDRARPPLHTGATPTSVRHGVSAVSPGCLPTPPSRRPLRLSASKRGHTLDRCGPRGEPPRQNEFRSIPITRPPR